MTLSCVSPHHKTIIPEFISTPLDKPKAPQPSDVSIVTFMRSVPADDSLLNDASTADPPLYTQPPGLFLPVKKLVRHEATFVVGLFFVKELVVVLVVVLGAVAAAIDVVL